MRGRSGGLGRLKRCIGLRVLAQAAIGFDAKRGDQVVLQNVSFSTNTPEVKVSGLENILGQAKNALVSQPGTLRALVTGMVGLMVIWFVLRPVSNEVITTLRNASRAIPSQISSEQRALADAGHGRGMQPALPDARPRRVGSRGLPSGSSATENH